MNPVLLEELKKQISGDVDVSTETLTVYNHDASIFSLTPQVVVFPKNGDDVKALVKFVDQHKNDIPDLSLTARAASTCMSGGGLSESIVIGFLKYFNHPAKIEGDLATVEPGIYYRDFEKQTLEHNLLFPTYPSSREICALGGMINNNCGGEKSLQYGKTEDWVRKMTMVLADGNTYEFKPLNDRELQAKMKQADFEGEIYKKIYELLTTNYELIKHAKPAVTKNSAGYYLWNVYDKEKGVFDLTKLFVGAQGTLGLMLDATVQLVPVKKHKEMLVIDLWDLSHLGQAINTILPYAPESLEMYDDKTLKLALKYFGGFGQKLGTSNIFSTFYQFLPEFMMELMHHLPKLVIQAEFTDDDVDGMNKKIAELEGKLQQFHPKLTLVPSEEKEKKYWLIRRESFSLLRGKIKDKYASPFIDDFVVNPEHLPEFLPKLNAIFAKYPSLIYTIAGHAGNGNFHIIPLMDIRDKTQQDIIPKLSKEVFDLVISYKGSNSGEHNDGLIRTPFLEDMYGKEIVSLFEKTKDIFDPQGIFNPRKKVRGDMDFAMQHIRQNW